MKGDGRGRGQTLSHVGTTKGKVNGKSSSHIFQRSNQSFK